MWVITEARLATCGARGIAGGRRPPRPDGRCGGRVNQSAAWRRGELPEPSAGGVEQVDARSGEGGTLGRGCPRPSFGCSGNSATAPILEDARSHRVIGTEQAEPGGLDGARARAGAARRRLRRSRDLVWSCREDADAGRSVASTCVPDGSPGAPNDTTSRTDHHVRHPPTAIHSALVSSGSITLRQSCGGAGRPAIGHRVETALRRRRASARNTVPEITMESTTPMRTVPSSPPTIC